MKEYSREAGAKAAKYTGKCTTIITHVSQSLILGIRSPLTEKTRILCSRGNDGQLPASEHLVSCRHSTQRPGASQTWETLGICRADKATELRRFTEWRAESTFIDRTCELYMKTAGISSRDNQDKTQCEDEVRQQTYPQNRRASLPALDSSGPLFTAPITRGSEDGYTDWTPGSVEAKIPQTRSVDSIMVGDIRETLSSTRSLKDGQEWTPSTGLERGR
jgi:hypothetical protein